ncbi:odorant receptor 7a [Haematobia irritans]|uniref:odorant receptor 7a n=1 Tax=Haematobia irritans TaxID=7368 RepID=UPI003F50B0B2
MDVQKRPLSNDFGKAKVATKEATTYLYRCFRIMGIHMPSKHRSAYIVYGILINCLTTIFTPITFTCSYFVKSNFQSASYGVILSSIQTSINVYGCAIKILMLIHYNPRLKVAEKLMDRMDERCQSIDEEHELQNVRDLGRKIVLLYLLAYWSYTSCTFISSLVSGVPSYSIYLFVIDWRRSRLEFYMASFIEYVLTSWTCLQQVANDSYGTVYVCILRAHVRIMLLRIRKMASNGDKSLEDNVEELKMCIKDHRNLIELYDVISPVISSTIFLQFSLTASILGITLINIAIFSTNFAVVAASSFYLVAVVIEIFPLCFYANCLLYDSDLLPIEIFHSSWNGQNRIYRKMIIFFIQRTQRSMELWAGKIFPINLNSFISIAKFSFSLYTLIKAMGIKEKLNVLLEYKSIFAKPIMEGVNLSENSGRLHQQLLEDGIPSHQLSKNNQQKSNQHKAIKSWGASDEDEVPQTREGLRYLYNGFRFLGIYLPTNFKFLYIIWSIIVNLYVTIYLPTGFIMGIVDATDDEMEIGNLLTSFQVSINVVGCSIKIILMFFLFPQLLKCEPIFEKLDNRCNSPEQKDLVRRFIHEGNRFVVLFAIAYWTYSTSTCISAVIFGRLPYNIYNPLVNAQESWVYFIVAVLMEMVPMDIACFQQVVDDSYAVIYVNILRTHIEALMMRLKQQNNEDDDGKKNVDELKLCIMDHKNIIELYNRIAPVISITIFVQFTITATLLGSTLINILIFATNVASMVASCFYVLAVVVEIFPLCYYAQCLMDENNRLAEVIFHSNWINQDLQYKKMLIFFMQRTQKTIEFSAGKIFPITLNSFLSIAKFSFSLYTVIKEMDLKERYGLQ